MTDLNPMRAIRLAKLSDEERLKHFEELHKKMIEKKREYQGDRYKNDPDFRQKRLEIQKKYYEKITADKRAEREQKKKEKEEKKKLEGEKPKRGRGRPRKITEGCSAED